MKTLLVIVASFTLLALGFTELGSAIARFVTTKDPVRVVRRRGDTVYKHSMSYRTDERGRSRWVGDPPGVYGGYGPMLQALGGMLLVGLGTGLAATLVSSRPKILRGIAATLALVWHGVGIGSCAGYLWLARDLDHWPFLLVVAYEWLGLIPLALAVPGGGRMGRLAAGVWYALLGGLLGAVAGAVLVVVSEPVRWLLSYVGVSFVGGAIWWLYATIGGGVVVSLAFAVLRLCGWEIPRGGKPLRWTRNSDRPRGG